MRFKLPGFRLNSAHFKRVHMTGLNRYIFRQLLVGALVVSVALACIVWLTQSLRFLEFVINKGLTIGAWIKLTMLLIPSFLAIVIPTAFFFVVVFIYNKLANDRELVVAQAAGISRISLAKPAVAAAAVAAAACYILTLYVVPGSMRAFNDLKWAMRNDASQLLLRDGAFNQITAGVTAYVLARGRDGELKGVMLHDARNATQPTTLFADRGVMAGGASGPHMILFNGTREQLDPDHKGLSILYFDSYTVDFSGLDNATADRTEDFRERGIFELFHAGPADGYNEIQIQRMRAEAHQRLLGPFSSFSYTLMALALLLTGSFDKRGQVGRIAGAVAVLIALQTANLGASDLAGKDGRFVPLMYVVGLLPVLLGLYIIAGPVDWGEIRRRGGMRIVST